MSYQYFLQPRKFISVQMRFLHTHFIQRLPICTWSPPHLAQNISINIHPLILSFGFTYSSFSKLQYIAGDDFTLADLFHISYANVLFNIAKRKDYFLNSRPNVAAWWERISSRPSWTKTLALPQVWFDLCLVVNDNRNNLAMDPTYTSDIMTHSDVWCGPVRARSWYEALEFAS